LFARVVLIGPPAAGKGTLAKALVTMSDRTRILSSGAIFSRLYSENSEMGQIVRSSLDEGGGMCPDDLVSRVVLEEVKSLADNDCEFILDGYPRTLQQHQVLIENFRVGLYVIFDIQRRTLIYSASHRRQCPICGLIFRSPKVTQTNMVSPCGHALFTEWQIRRDDDKEYFLTRLSSYETFTRPLVNQIVSNHKSNVLIVRSQADVRNSTVLKQICHQSIRAVCFRTDE
jgi:adenylate kinase